MVNPLEKEVEDLIYRINLALTEVDGKKYLPLWLTNYVNGPIFSISADTLQGIKIGLTYLVNRVKEEGEKDGTPAE